MNDLLFCAHKNKTLLEPIWMRTLGNISSKARDNNFNLLRFIAATMVLFGHSYSSNDPLAAYYQVPSHHMAVDIFFAISGFLVTGSLFARHSLIAFALARLLRLVPGIFVSCAITALTVGLYLTTLPISDYLKDTATWSYVWVNSMLLETQVNLPGIDVGMNGSLWTIPFEVRMYAILAVVGVAIYWWPRLLNIKAAQIVIVLIAISANIGLMMIAYAPVAISTKMLASVELSYWRFLAMFFLGAAFYILRHRIPLSIVIVAVLCGLIYWSKTVYFQDTGNNSLFFGMYSLTLPYLVLYFAYLPSRFLQGFNKIGDYSYGIYLYAFPIQRLTEHLGLATSPITWFLWSFPLTVALAAFSWHIVEKPALQLKNLYKAPAVAPRE
ncbi:MAG: acyltransferase [Pseudomonadales bacterium]